VSIPAAPNVEAPPATNDFAEALNSLVDASPDTLTGVVIDRSGKIVITVGKYADVASTEAAASQRAEQFKQELRSRPAGIQAAKEIPSVAIKSVGRSRSDLNKVRAVLQARLLAGDFG